VLRLRGSPFAFTLGACAVRRRLSINGTPPCSCPCWLGSHAAALTPLAKLDSKQEAHSTITSRAAGLRERYRWERSKNAIIESNRHGNIDQGSAE